MEFPNRNTMYADEILSKSHQKLYGISQYLEEYSHAQCPFLNELIKDIGPTSINLGKICNNISSLSIYPLLAACPLTIQNREL